MKLFISWSGERSKLLAESLHLYIPHVINAVKPWISSSDINPGARWASELAGELDKTKYGILCLTQENLTAPWLMFEAGALAKQVDKSKVVPLLLDNKAPEIQMPLAQFQSVQATADGLKKLVMGLNNTVFEEQENGLSSAMLDEAFNMWWPRLNDAIQAIKPSSDFAKPKEERSDRDMIQETLLLVRDLRRQNIPPEVDELSIEETYDLRALQSAFSTLISEDMLTTEDFKNYLNRLIDFIPQVSLEARAEFMRWIVKHQIDRTKFSAYPEAFDRIIVALIS